MTIKRQHDFDNFIHYILESNVIFKNSCLSSAENTIKHLLLKISFYVSRIVGRFIIRR